ncbi:cardiolipin synthase [Bacillaceae bacterium SIJ1]|uniref:cardiolipin synthase n=1 Tax=Litoribacterium kuwaitense TaxID=1398745 RepID=UPI0013ED3EBB|nr:cardiolipin synthase [Litoribacterium kuwaitense]NGP44664.1 cardiolipin synthase [Litoribacterium kuwaitense]
MLTSAIVICTLVLNIMLATFVVFRERRDISATWAWLLVLLFVPVVGFVLYLFFAQNLSRYRLFDSEDFNQRDYGDIVSSQLKKIKEGHLPYRNVDISEHRDMIYMHLLHNQAAFSDNNIFEFYTSGDKKFKQLIEDIKQAKESIHLQYYIYRRDNLGKAVREALIQKAKEGLRVRVLYDALGSRTLNKGFFKELIKHGGEVESFFPSKLRFINIRLNYRNHRKIVVIDGKIGYIGGFNVGDEYLGLSEKFGYWRDNHLRVQGTAVYSLQARFILDWNQASRYHDIRYHASLFPEPVQTGNIGAQIVTSGPDSELEHIKYGYLKMISSAKKNIYIQTPYFIPDASMLDALRVACLSDVKVHIMIPNKPDHPFVYWATLSHLGELLKLGANVYTYTNGFIHSKTIVVDGDIASVGTANIDVRSFKLNFEVNAFLYDVGMAKHLTQQFQEDMKDSELLTLEKYEQRPRIVRFKESVSRLLSPIL